MRARKLARVRWALAYGAAVSGCVVSFNDYPLAEGDASALGGSSGIGGIGASGGAGGSGAGSGGSAAGSGGSAAGSGGSALGGSAGVSTDASAGAGGSGGGGGSGGTGGAGGASGTGAVGGVGGLGNDACVPLECDGLLCGAIDNLCGQTINCACSGSAGCVSGLCTQVVNTYCDTCKGQFPETHPTTIQIETCGATCPVSAVLSVCTLTGWSMKVAVTTNGACPAGHHLAMALGKDCAQNNRTICVED